MKVLWLDDKKLIDEAGEKLTVLTEDGVVDIAYNPEPLSSTPEALLQLADKSGCDAIAFRAKKHIITPEILAVAKDMGIDIYITFHVGVPTMEFAVHHSEPNHVFQAMHRKHLGWYKVTGVTVKERDHTTFYTYDGIAVLPNTVNIGNCKVTIGPKDDDTPISTEDPHYSIKVEGKNND